MTPEAARIRIATRSSALALWQAEHVADLLRARGVSQVELIEVSTTGDRDRSAPLAEFGGVGVFTREIQNAVLDGRADVAVHSLKDLPTEPTARMTLAAVPERASMFDALVLPASRAVAAGLDDLPRGARMGTGSLRRRAQLLHARPDLIFGEVRGNVETRLRKLDEGEFAALVLAEAGLDRLGLSARVSARLAPPHVYPAVGQGALGIECRTDDEATRRLLAQVNDRPTFASTAAERRLLNRLGGGCHAPVGVCSTIDAERLELEAVVLSADGKQRLLAWASGDLGEPDAIADLAADDLMRQGALALLAPVP